MGAKYSDINTVELVIDLVGRDSQLMLDVKLRQLCKLTREHARYNIDKKCGPFLAKMGLVPKTSNEYSVKYDRAISLLLLNDVDALNKYEYPQLTELLYGGCSDCNSSGRKGVVLKSMCKRKRYACMWEKLVCVEYCEYVCRECQVKYTRVYSGDWRNACPNGHSYNRVTCNCGEDDSESSGE